MPPVKTALSAVLILAATVMASGAALAQSGPVEAKSQAQAASKPVVQKPAAKKQAEKKEVIKKKVKKVVKKPAVEKQTPSEQH